MSCYHPMVAFKDKLRTKQGDIIPHSYSKYRFVGKLEDLGDFEDIKERYADYDPILLPCGNCVGCRLDISRKWADRMCLEYDHTKKAVFVTLTYDDDHLPVNDFGVPTLVKSDMQTFMKDLRGAKPYEHKIIRFYGSGEYGETFGRPHLHIILFGLELQDFSSERYIREFQLPDFFTGRTDLQLYYAGQNDLHQPYFRCPYIDNVVWKKGRVCISEFSWNTAAYVARYVRKKLNGELAEKYEDLGIQPPFALMSRRPGIAGYFLEDHPEKNFFEETTFSFQGKCKPIPDFVFDKLEKIDFLAYNNIKRQRKELANDKMLLELQQTDLSYNQLLGVKEHKAENAFNQLKRDRIEHNLY